MTRKPSVAPCRRRRKSHSTKRRREPPRSEERNKPPPKPETDFITWKQVLITVTPSVVSESMKWVFAHIHAADLKLLIAYLWTLIQ